jgi:hypothetical protein
MPEECYSVQHTDYNLDHIYTCQDQNTLWYWLGFYSTGSPQDEAQRKAVLVRIRELQEEMPA